MSDELVYCNGIDPDTGAYRIPPMSREEFAGILLGEQKPENFGVLQARSRRDADLGVREGIDPADLASAGWGVIFTQGADPAVEEALGDLLALRRAQAGEQFFIFKGDADKGGGYRAGESARQFLKRHNIGPAEPADPRQGVPYYLLLVGSPQEIPYEFQTQLDVVYAVGRVHFDDLEGYGNYARSVCDAENGRLPAAERAAFFGVANPDDLATKSSMEKLVSPLMARLAARADYPRPWQFDAYLADDAQMPASRANLERLLGGDLKPGLLFTAGHGVDIPWKASDAGDDAKTGRLLAHQGGLICQDWAGPRSGPTPRDSYLIGEDLPAERDLRGLLAFFFACFGGGTPMKDQFFRRFLQDRPGDIAPHPFIAGLPKRMLGLPAGALAVIAHVERTWPFSFSWPGIAEPQLAAFESALSVLLKHQPVGMAMEYFNQRYAALTVPLFDLKEQIDAGMQYDQGEWISIWTAQSDARGYIIVGDPAARLPLPAAGDQGA